MWNKILDVDLTYKTLVEYFCNFKSFQIHLKIPKY